jgi:hypothetical protein
MLARGMSIIYHAWWGELPNNPKNLTNFRLITQETGNWWENKSLEAKCKTVMFISAHCQLNSFYGIHLSGGA